MGASKSKVRVSEEPRSEEDLCSTMASLSTETAKSPSVLTAVEPSQRVFLKPKYRLAVASEYVDPGLNWCQEETEATTPPPRAESASVESLYVDAELNWSQEQTTKTEAVTQSESTTHYIHSSYVWSSDVFSTNRSNTRQQMEPTGVAAFYAPLQSSY